MHVVIATPTAGHVVTTAYTASLIAATQAINAIGGTYRHMIFNGSDVALARNYLAHDFLSDAEATHLLFIDSDILADTDVFARLFGADLPVVGGIYPERDMNRAAFASLLRDGMDEAKANAAAQRFSALPYDGGYLIRDGLCRVSGIGAGCLLIRRDALEHVIASGDAGVIQSRKMAAQLGVAECHDFFGLIPTGDGDYVSEDYAFCHRVLSAGIEIWGLADMSISHMGRQSYAGRFIDHLEHHATAKPSGKG